MSVHVRLLWLSETDSPRSKEHRAKIRQLTPLWSRRLKGAQHRCRTERGEPGLQELRQVPSEYRQHETPPCHEQVPLPVEYDVHPSLQRAPVRQPLDIQLDDVEERKMLSKMLDVLLEYDGVEYTLLEYDGVERPKMLSKMLDVLLEYDGVEYTLLEYDGTE